MKRLISLCVVAALAGVVTGCRLTGDLTDLPLSTIETQLVGHWRHVHGIGNVWNWEFTDTNRSARYFSTNAILGDTEAYYVWAADSNEIIIYEPDTLFSREHSRYQYTMSDTATLVLDGTVYERQ